ncbi:MAG: hypothetical protein ACN4GW_02535 [Desulforhopalus sp.]
MHSYILYRSLSSAFTLTFFLIVSFLFGGQPAVAAPIRHIQEVQGYLEEGSRVVYTLSDLKKGDMLYAYITSTNGNLDPLIGISDTDKSVDLTPEEILEAVVGSPQDLVTSFTEFTNNRFLAWDDDSGRGYDASLQFQIPEDGTYFIFVESTITSQTFATLEPGFTSGAFRMLFGKNAPEVADGKGEPVGQPIAAVDQRYVQRNVFVQRLDVKLSEKKPVTFHHFKKLQPGDLIFVRLSNRGSSPLPQLFITDFGSKPLVFGNIVERDNSVLLKYQTPKDADNLFLYVDASNSDTIPVGAEYRLDVGINAPEVLHGDVIENGLYVFQQSTNVKIGLSVDQIANVDQQSETFSVVGSLQLIWQEPALAFSPDKCECVIKKMGLDKLKAYASENDILLPNFIFFNQQGNRWVQGQYILIEPSGRATYNERFTTTLQEPSFDFRAYPFDRQRFNIRVDLLLPTEAFLFEGVDRPGNAPGDQLGEEEWSVIDYVQKVETVSLGRNHETSRFTMSLDVERHLNYYIIRILIPLFLIISVSWVIFFLKDYGRQLEVASGNLLVFVAFNFTISEDLPRLGYLTLLDRMIITSFCCAALVVLISVFQKRLETKGRGDWASRIDKIVLVSYPLVYLSLISYEYLIVTSKLGT